MSAETSAPPSDIAAEVSALIHQLHRTEQRLRELTAGEIDTVTDHDGRTFFLRHAQEQLRHGEASRQAAILNALPAHIALLDAQGVIISVNETWRRFASANAMRVPGHGMGLNYLEICENAGESDAHRVANGIRSVLNGRSKTFSMEYPCHSPAEEGWFLLTVTPLADDRPGGAIVMHLDITAERKTEQNLRVSESRFRQMAETIREVFFLQNLDSSQMYYVSPAYERVWGRTCESVYADPKSWADSIHPDDLNYACSQLEEGRNRGFDYEFRIIRPGGEIRWIHARGFPIMDDTGIPYRIAGVASDITARKHASDELHESNRRFSDMLGNVQLVSLMLDGDAKITYCNDHLLRLTGWRREELIGKDWFDRFIPPGQGDDVRATFSALLADLPSGAHHENEILTRSGEKRLIQWNNTLLRSPAGEVSGTASIGIDITERKKAEATLRLQSVALNAAANAMIIIDRDFTIVWMNPAFTELTGYAEEEAIGRNVQDLLFSGVHDPAFYKEIRDTIDAGESWRGEMTNRRSDGRLYPEASIITPVKDDDGTINHFISIKMDLTARRQMEERLRQAQKMEAVGQLAGGVAHEFNNLLQALMSMAAIIRLRAGTEEVAKIGTEMELQVRHGASLTQQLLVFSRRQAIQKSDLDLREEVEKASVLLRRLIPENIRIVVETSPERVSVEGDEGQMRQVLLNLAINARDGMPAGGTLTLRTGSSFGESFLEVEDTGLGMDEATRAHIFEPFFTTKVPGQGTGLGLAVVYGIVEQHGGRIEVRSRPGEGSRFRVFLPTVLSDGVPISRPGPSAEFRAGRGRVLLVEDDKAVREGIAELVEMIGYEVIAVASGEEAIAIELEPIPDLLLSDITLPGIAGSVLGERLRQRWPSLQVVLMSGYLAETLRADAATRGWHFLQKPFELTDLAAQLGAALDARPQEQ